MFPRASPFLLEKWGKRAYIYMKFQNVKCQ